MSQTSPSNSSHREGAAHFHRREEAQRGRPVGLEVSVRPKPVWNPTTPQAQLALTPLPWCPTARPEVPGR